MNRTITVKVIRQHRSLPAPVAVPAEPDHLREFLDINGVCTWLGISDKTLRAWREKRGFPTIVVDGWIAFSRDEVRAWLSQQTTRGDEPTSIRRVS